MDGLDRQDRRGLPDRLQRPHRAEDAPPPAASPAVRLRALVDTGADRLPLPGHGRSIERWRTLAAIAAEDLSLVKWFEAHADALAILAEAGNDPVPGATYGMWAAEPPNARVVFRDLPDGDVRLDGLKAWCSGAASLDRALLTAWREDGSGPWLVDVDLRQSGVDVDTSPWRAVGMAATASADARFEGARGRRVGGAGFYLSRAGFWQGGIGIAACWHGAACAVAEVLRANAKAAAGTSATTTGLDPDPGWHRLLALGEVDRLLTANAALLREAGAWIDRHPGADARAWAWRTRAAGDECAQQVLRAATRALGAGPLCRDARFATLAADLPVFIRQCHGDRDLVALGATNLQELPTPWML